MTIKPNRFDLIAGVIYISVLGLGAPLGLGVIALSLVREPPAEWVIAPVLVFLAIFSFAFTHIAKLCVFRVGLLGDSIEFRGMLRNRRIRAVDIEQIYFTENFRYAHIILSVGSGSASMSSLLWSREAFHNLMVEVASWAARLEMPAPVTVDTVNPGADEASKRATKILKSTNLQDWAVYTLIFAALTLCSTLLQAIMPVLFPS